ncbi:MAG TPA: nickel pincer cofactor biosynthesis protein LarB [Ktedonobacterales bacterium]
MSQRRTDDLSDEMIGDVAEDAGGDEPSWAIAQVTRQGARGPLAPLVEARLDLGRAARKGIPEVVLAESKRDDQLVAIVRAFLERNGYALVSRVRPGQLDLLASAFADAALDVREVARAVALHAPGYQRRVSGGHIGVLTAGAGDVPVAEEARLVAEEMGCRVTTIYDVGVAGIHRLFGPLSDLLASDVAALVVCAGMDGALPSVVAGLAHVPVIGCPTSIGYGAGGKGRAALLAMLQTCAPGLTVVNIDNGIGAGATAALMANQLAAVRAGEQR